MQILYTGATKQGIEQLDAGSSLGGFVSNSVIPNDLSSNIFSGVSALSIQNKRRETKMIAIKNNDGDILTDLSFKFDLGVDSICKYKVAFVLPTITGGDSCFEKIANTNVLPYYATFLDVVSGEPFNIHHLALDAYLGIWLVREYDYTSDNLKKKSCTDWLAVLEANPQAEVNQIETLALTINYTVGEPSVSVSASTGINVNI